jgi:hypothetical protein
MAGGHVPDPWQFGPPGTRNRGLGPTEGGAQVGPAALRPGGRRAHLSYVVVRREGEPQVYAETADLHGEPLLCAIAERIRARMTAGRRAVASASCVSDGARSEGPGSDVDGR